MDIEVSRQCRLVCMALSADMENINSGNLMQLQVEQLEKSVHTAGNWRERRNPDGLRGGEPPKRPFDGPPKVIKKRNDVAEEERGKQQGARVEKEHGGGRRSGEGAVHKDADIVILDASVLVHGLYHLKKWCRDGREEIVIVPLEGASPRSALGMLN